MVAMSLARESCDVDTSSVLQVKTDQSAGLAEVGRVLELASAGIASLKSDAVDTKAQDAIDSFSQNVMASATSMLQKPRSVQEALLRRASQSGAMATVVEDFIELPAETKKMAIGASLASSDMVTMLGALPSAERRALLLQYVRLGGNEEAVSRKEQSLASKSCEKDRLGRKVCTTVSRNGAGGTRHTVTTDHRSRKTETATWDKNGDFVHFHQHLQARSSGNHRSYGASSTESITRGKNGFSHSYRLHRDTLSGDTETGSKSTDHFGNTHEHEHKHWPNGRSSKFGGLPEAETSTRVNGRGRGLWINHPGNSAEWDYQPPGTECRDMDGDFTDTRGQQCESYTSEPGMSGASSLCGHFDTIDFDAKRMCCGCHGGTGPTR